jgi:hypothetical protein
MGMTVSGMKFKSSWKGSTLLNWCSTHVLAAWLKNEQLERLMCQPPVLDKFKPVPDDAAAAWHRRVCKERGRFLGSCAPD